MRGDEREHAGDDARDDRLTRRRLLRLGALASVGAMLALSACGSGEDEDEDEDDEDDD